MKKIKINLELISSISMLFFIMFFTFSPLLLSASDNSAHEVVYVVDYVKDHFPTDAGSLLIISIAVLELLLRVLPSKRSNSVIRFLLKILDVIVKDRAKRGRDVPTPYHTEGSHISQDKVTYKISDI